jgi:hypothetical protein
MNNHKIYTDIEYGITYKVLKYNNDNSNDQNYVDKFIKKNKCCKVIESNYLIFISDINNYHNYYNPGEICSKITYYIDGEIISENIKKI